MADDKKMGLMGSIVNSIKSKMSLGASRKQEGAPAEATNPQSVQNIDFKLIKTSFINIDNSFVKLNETFEGIHGSLQFLIEENRRNAYKLEEKQLEGDKGGVPPPKPDGPKVEKEGSWFANPIILAAISGIIYAVLPKETQERLKAVLGGFSTGVEKTTGGFSNLSSGMKAVGIGLGLFVGGKLIKNVVEAITLSVKLVKSFASMGKFGKAAIVGIAAVGIGKYLMDDKAAESIEKEKPEPAASPEVEKKEFFQDEKTDPLLDDSGKPVAIMEEKANPASPGPEQASSAPAGVGQPSKEQPMATAEPAASPETPSATPKTVNEQIREQAPKKPEPAPAPAPAPAAVATPAPAAKPAPAPAAVAVPTPVPVATKPSTTKDGKLLIPSETVGKAIESASKRVGVDQSIMMAMAKQESGFNPQARAGTSSAAGLFQFISSTWNSMVKKYSGSFPELHRGPMDVDASSIAGAIYIKENSNFLKQNNIPVNGTTIYASHFLGAGGARTLLSSPPNAVAANIMPKAAAANKNIFYKKDGSARSIAEVQEVLYNKVGKEAEKYAALNSNTPTQVAMAPTPVPATVATLQATPAPVAAPTESSRAPKGTQIALLSTKNEAMASPKAMAPIVQNTTNNKSQSQASKPNSGPMEIPLPIASRGSLSGNVRHDTQYA